MTSKRPKKAKIPKGNEKKAKYSQPCEGALDPMYLIKAQMRDDEWYKAKIIDCRPLKEAATKRKRADGCYEYYVHYLDFDRRMDEWIPRSRIELVKRFISLG